MAGAPLRGPAPLALFCWDADTNPTCGLQVLDRVVGTSNPAASAPRVVDGQIYLAADGGKVYCLDPATNQPCPGGPISDGLPVTAADRYDAVAHGTRLYVSKLDGSGWGPAQVACVDVAARATCPGWTASQTLTSGDLVNRHSPSGVPDGVCGVAPEDATAGPECVGDDSPASRQAIGSWPLADSYYSIYEEAEFPTRTLFATGLGGQGMGCWDWSTGALCTGGRWKGGTVTEDPKIDPKTDDPSLPTAYGASSDGTCAVGLGDPGLAFTVDQAGATPCTSLSSGKVRRVLDLRDQRCAGTGVGAARWVSARVLEADLRTGGDFASLKVVVTDPTTRQVLASREMVGTDGLLPLSAIDPALHPALDLDATADSADGKDAWASGNPPRLVLTWHADPLQACFHTTTSIDCARTSTTPIGMTAAPAVGAAVSASLTLRPTQCRTLTVVASGSGGGVVTSSPPGSTCTSTCRYHHPPGTSVRLTAAASSGSAFVGWSGGGCPATGPCTVSLTGDTTVTAAFRALASPTPSASPPPPPAPPAGVPVVVPTLASPPEAGEAPPPPSPTPSPTPSRTPSPSASPSPSSHAATPPSPSPRCAQLTLTTGPAVLTSGGRALASATVARPGTDVQLSAADVSRWWLPG